MTQVLGINDQEPDREGASPRPMTRLCEPEHTRGESQNKQMKSPRAPGNRKGKRGNPFLEGSPSGKRRDGCCSFSCKS